MVNIIPLRYHDGMKRPLKQLLTTVAVLILSVQGLFAVNYHFYLNTAASGQISAVQYDTLPTRSRVNVQADIGALSLRITPRQVLSLPVSVSWSGNTVTKAIDILHDHFDITGALGWQYDFTGLLSMRASLGAGVRLFPDVMGWTLIYSQAQAEFLVKPLPCFAVTFPLKLVVTDYEADVSLGVGLSFYMDVLPQRNAEIEEEESAL